MGLSRKFANLGKALDSGSSGDFLTVGDSGGVFRDVEWTEIANKPSYVDSAAATALIDSAYVQARQTDIGLDSGMITNLVDSAYVQLRQGEIGLDSAQVISIIDSAYVSARTPSALDSGGVTSLIDSNYVTNRVTANSGFKNYRYTATADQTTFDSTDVNGNTLSFSEDGILVFYNGVVLEKTVDYTTSTNSITLTEPADSGVSVNIATWTLSTSSSSSASSIAWGGDRGVFGGGYTQSPTTFSNIIDYYDIATAGNATDFGDLTVGRVSGGGASSGSRGVFMAGSRTTGATNIIDYIAISTTGNATDFGDMLFSDQNANASASDVTRGYSLGGQRGSAGSYAYLNNIQYITFDTTGNATDGGNLTAGKRSGCAWNDATTAVAMGGVISGGTPVNNIDYFTMSTSGNASDFGDLTDTVQQRPAGAGDGTYALCAGGRRGTSSNPNGDSEAIDYITIQTTGNASNFGDLTAYKSAVDGAGNGTYATFAGGDANGTRTNVIEVVTVSTPANATDFGDLTAGREDAAGSFSGAAA